jgi:hypothetical protein
MHSCLGLDGFSDFLFIDGNGEYMKRSIPQGAMVSYTVLVAFFISC